MRGVFLDVHTVTDGDLDLDALAATLPDWTFLDITATENVAQAIQGTDIVISNKAALDRNTIAAADTLQLICIAATGTNNIDLSAAAERNIAVCNVRAYATTSVVEHVFMLILALSRRLFEHASATQQGGWQRADRFSMLDYPFRELAGRTLGIIGYGELGKAVANMAQAFGMQVLIAQRPGTPPEPGRYPLEQLLSEATVISLHCPLTPDTENLLDETAFRQMRRDAILINTARGGIVNETDLLHALHSGEIAGAAVDVLTEEPPRNGNPLLGVQLPNLIVTPHVAWAGLATRQKLIDELVANIQAFLDGKPRNIVMH